MPPSPLHHILRTKKIHLDTCLGTSSSSKNKIAIISLHDPDRHNALDEEMGRDFQKAIQHVTDDDQIACLVLRGAGNKAFSAGGDLEFLNNRTKSSPYTNARTMREFYARFLCIRHVPCPTIAAINGAAVGAGLGVAMACDLRVVAANAKVGVTFTKLGLHPGMGTTHYLPLLLGAQNAADLLLSGRLVTGKRFMEMGGALDAVAGENEGESTVARAMELAQELASGAPLAMRATTMTLRSAQDQTLQRALLRESDAQAQSYATVDLAEGVSAVAGKRKPVWKGE